MLDCCDCDAKLGGFCSVTPRMMELPRYDSDGAPAGVNDAAEDGGGGPAGVVEGLAPKLKPPRCGVFSGVEGAELPGPPGLESGTMNLLAMVVILVVGVGAACSLGKGETLGWAVAQRKSAPWSGAVGKHPKEWHIRGSDSQRLRVLQILNSDKVRCCCNSGG